MPQIPEGTLGNGMEYFYQPPESGVSNYDAVLLLDRAIAVAARCAIGDGLTRQTVSLILQDMAHAIEYQDCAEDMSKIVIPMN